jgi:hypothetical protein
MPTTGSGSQISPRWIDIRTERIESMNASLHPSAGCENSSGITCASWTLASRGGKMALRQCTSMRGGDEEFPAQTVYLVE